MKVKLSEGNGGEEMQALVREIRAAIGSPGKWENTDNDSAAIKLGNDYLFFTTDSYVASPIFFPGGDIGKIAACGTINDLAVTGAEPLGLSLSFVLEEGFDKEALGRILASIASVSRETGIPIATGDTKVMEKGKLDGLIINTAGVGLGNAILDAKIEPGDKLLLSGGIGEHSIALLSKRFEFETEIQTDSKPLLEEMRAIRGLVKQAKDLTRGGLSAALNEMARKNAVGMLVHEESIPVKKQVYSASEILGLEPLELACEGRLACACKPEAADAVLEHLKGYNPEAGIIGEATEGKDVVLKTRVGKRMLHNPTGNLVPRIC